MINFNVLHALALVVVDNVGKEANDGQYRHLQGVRCRHCTQPLKLLLMPGAMLAQPTKLQNPKRKSREPKARVPSYVM